MKKVLLGVVAAIALVGCGGGDRCSASSKCSADPKPTEADIKACQEAQKMTTTKCFAEGNKFADCAQAKQVCGSDNKTDGIKTLAACQAEFDAYSKCITM